MAVLEGRSQSAIGATHTMGEFHSTEGKIGSRLYIALARPLCRYSKLALRTQAEVMKSSLRLLAPAVALVGMVFSRDTAFADVTSELPKRALGLWRITTISPEVGMQSHDVCIGEGDSIIGDQPADCAQPSVTSAGDQVIVTIECGVGDRRNIKSLLFTGDFKSWYRAQSKVTAGTHRSSFTIDARFLSMNCAH
jgi:hypothetical protein